MLESLWIPKSDCLGENMRILLVVVLTLVIAPGDTMPTVPFPPSAPSQSGDQVSKIPPDQLDSLVAPIALYPDPLLAQTRSEEHTSELQSHHDLVCRLLLEKKKATRNTEA